MPTASLPSPSLIFCLTAVGTSSSIACNKLVPACVVDNAGYDGIRICLERFVVLADCVVQELVEGLGRIAAEEIEHIAANSGIFRILPVGAHSAAVLEFLKKVDGAERKIRPPARTQLLRRLAGESPVQRLDGNTGRRIQRKMTRERRNVSPKRIIGSGARTVLGKNSAQLLLEFFRQRPRDIDGLVTTLAPACCIHVGGVHISGPACDAVDRQG